MEYKPVIYNSEIVNLLLAGKKTQTRRIVKEVEAYTPYRARPSRKSRSPNGQWDFFYTCQDFGGSYETTITVQSPYAVGDVIWIKESHVKIAGRYLYYADHKDDDTFFVTKKEAEIHWHPSIVMPREGARIFLRVTSVRVERLNEISPYDSLKEGAAEPGEFPGLWERMLKPADRDRYGWEANPWVWVVDFERCERPEGWC